MNNTNSYTLRIKVLLGLSIFIVLTILSSLYQLKVLKLIEHNYQFVLELNKIQQLGAVYPRRSETYVNNAARDYESYNRDVQIFHKDIIGDIELLDKLLKEFTSNSSNVAFALPKFFQEVVGLNQQYNKVLESVEKANDQWRMFLTGFNEKIGNKKAEPRIEWGAKFIIKENPKVNKAITIMADEYLAFTEKQKSLSSTVLNIIIVSIILFGAFCLLWFYFKVIKRISRTVEACNQVANGDYGYVLPVEGDDELTVLAQAFNILSNRSQLVISMLGELQHAPSQVHALNIIVKASGGYLPVSWACVIGQNETRTGMGITHALPPKSLNNWAHRELDLESAFGHKISASLANKKPILINDIKGFIEESSEDKLLIDMLKATEIKALFALPLVTEQGWQGLILFGTRTGQYTEQHTELLENLSPLIATNFARLSFS